MPVEIPFQKHLDFEYGQPAQLSPLVRRVIANNPSAFTHFGTGSYIVGQGNVAIIDPGPADQTHIDALLAATRGEQITHILVTHTHLDHSPGCALLQQHSDAKTYAFGSHGTGTDGIARPRDESEFGADWEFTPDVLLSDHELIQGDQWSLRSLYSPGHATNHLSFYLEEESALFCGDAVMGWSTTIVSPPDGNMHDYMSTLKMLITRTDKIYYPTHGAPIEKPKSFVQALYDHRLEREQQIIECIKSGTHTIDGMVPIIYSALDTSMYPAAARSLLASIESLLQAKQIKTNAKKPAELLDTTTGFYLS